MTEPRSTSAGGVLRSLVTASRPLSWVNTAYPFAAAYLLASDGVDARLVVGTLFFLIPYNLLMYGINDVFDYESDLRNPRKGGVEGAVGWFRHNHLVPMPEVDSLDQLNEQIKLRLAERLLRDSHLDLASIALRLGYAETASFSRAFNRWTNSPPGKWRSNAHLGDI